MPLIPFKGIMPRVHPTAFIAPNAMIIGDVEIGAYASIWYACTLRGDVNFIRIGSRTNIQDGSVVHVAEQGHGTIVGNNVTVGHMALLHDCIVADHGFIGMHSVALDGSVIESYAMLAAGAVLTGGKRIPAGELWAGTPARLHRTLRSNEREEIAYRAEQYVRLGIESKVTS